ncbi:hypothetical protein EDD21DRAFT_440257 [Dissophora ornata]|nr:hypothetical protein BGZ58_000398 [Dissophora ornata]KAI8605519.1 hypothetical protein EDD21DRAFT_440257 [Dissophora ornata]
MNEKQSKSLLPTTSEASGSSETPIRCAIDRRRQHLRRLFKLSLLGLLLYYLLIMPNDEDSRDADTFSGYSRRENKKYHFEKHMQADVNQLVAGSLESSIVWERLAEMTDTYGPRIVGSEALEKSIDWIMENAKADGLSVTTEEVVVDYWQRHEESLHFLSPTRGQVKMHILGLGYSVSTPDPINGLTAEIIVVYSKEELDQLGKAGEVEGKIVLYNKPFINYDGSAIFRAFGSVWAQEHGAVAALVRSVGPFSLQTPHTGAANPASIPSAAITAEDADLLERSLKRHQQDPKKFKEWPKVKLVMGATTGLGAKVSRNIIIELKGREKPEEIVVVGGHTDSWDVGVGAVDDGAGCFIAWETLRQLSLLERPPRRTVRAVLWTSEENTSVGGVVYAMNHPQTNTSRHVFAFESDIGVFDPYGIDFTSGRHGKDNGQDSFEFMVAAGEYFLGSRKDLGYPGAGKHVRPDAEGADIDPLCKQGVACAQFTPADPFPLPYSTSPYALQISPADDGHRDRKRDDKQRHHRHHSHHSDEEAPRRPVDSGYFYYHHTEADTMGAFTPDQVKRSAAVMAIWTYIAAESPVEL